MHALGTTRDRSEPRLRQLAIFLTNRLGALRRAVQLLSDQGIRIGGISVLESKDHAVVRLVVDRPDGALEVLEAEGYGGGITEVLGVALPPGPSFGMQRVLSVLLGAEVSLWYVYGLIVGHDGHPVLALQADDLEMAGRVLRSNQFPLVGQDDLHWPDPDGTDTFAV